MQASSSPNAAPSLCRAALGAIASLAILLSACGGGTSTQDASQSPDSESQGQHNRWVGAWAAAPVGPADLAIVPEFIEDITVAEKTTLRMIVRSTIAGRQVRVRLSNELGDAPAPVQIGSARVALRATGSGIVAGSDRVLKFNGQTSVTIPPKGKVYSDPVDLDVPALADLAVSLYLPQQTVVQSGHYLTRQRQYEVSGSDLTAAAVLPDAAATGTAWRFLTGVDVIPKTGHSGALVILGDSLTDGDGSYTLRVDAPAPWTNWPNRLADRVQAQAPLKSLAVLNAGISGNRVLNDGAQTVPPARAGQNSLTYFGESALKRFDRDVAGQSGASCVLIFEGINDIGQGVRRGQPVTAEQIIDGHKALIEKARLAGLRVLGATLTPFEGVGIPLYYSAENEAKRQAVNAWIRSTPLYDTVLDFDALVRDPAAPAKLLPQYDSGDHLHLSNDGYQALANAVSLHTLKHLCL